MPIVADAAWVWSDDCLKAEMLTPNASRDLVSGATLATHVSRETRNRLEVFAQAVVRWNRVAGLVSDQDMSILWSRHIQDCLQLCHFVPAGARSILDMGSGAGFPGMILAIATHTQCILVEANRRKAAFLREAMRACGANAVVINDRIENVDLSVDVITARAFAPLSQLFQLAYPRLKGGGRMIFPKGRTIERELAETRRLWKFEALLAPSETDPSSRILCARNLRPRAVSHVLQNTR